MKLPVRLGAVSYLNARPLTWALDRAPERWQIRYDVPAVCSRLLHAGDVDLGLIPSIEYLHADDYLLVPGVGVVSHGAVASVALFTRVPVDRIRRVAVDTSSRSSVALLRILCRRHFRIAPELLPRGPRLDTMVQDAEAALLIGDPALEADHASLGLEKVDLGDAWTTMTGLPFVYAAWTGRRGAGGGDDVRALQAAQREGARSTAAIAAEYGKGDAVATERAAVYLRDNVKHDLGREEAAGLQLFLDYAAELNVAPRTRRLEFF